MHQDLCLLPALPTGAPRPLPNPLDPLGLARPLGNCPHLARLALWFPCTWAQGGSQAAVNTQPCGRLKSLLHLLLSQLVDRRVMTGPGAGSGRHPRWSVLLVMVSYTPSCTFVASYTTWRMGGSTLIYFHIRRRGVPQSRQAEATGRLFGGSCRGCSVGRAVTCAV